MLLIVSVMPEVLELSTNDCDINGDLSVTLSSSEGDCTTVLENTLVAGSTNSIYELGDCATSGFIDGVSKIQLKQAGIDDLCFGKMIVKLTNGKQYSCSSGWSKNGGTIECNPVKRDIGIYNYLYFYNRLNIFFRGDSIIFLLSS